MRTILTAAAMMLAAASAPVLAESGFDGSWTAKVPGPSGQGGLSVTFAFASGDTPSGSVTVQGGQTYDLVNVKIEQDRIAFQVEGEEQNLYSGKRSGDQLEMQVKYQSHENGTRVWSFVAKRAGQAMSTADIDGDWTGDIQSGGAQTVAATLSFHTTQPPSREACMRSTRICRSWTDLSTATRSASRSGPPRGSTPASSTEA